jgi:hypothetical protein
MKSSTVPLKPRDLASWEVKRRRSREGFMRLPLERLSRVRRGRKDILDTSDALCPSVNVCCYVLIDTMEGDTVVSKMGGGRKVEVVDISSQAGSKPEG